MADPRFFKNSGPVSLDTVLKATGAELPLGVLPEPSRLFSDVAALSAADADKISFFDNRKYLDAFRQTQAGACFVKLEFISAAPVGTLCLVHKNPYKAYAITASLFYPPAKPQAQRHSTAVMASSAQIGADCDIGPYVVIGQNVQIGARVRIGAHAVIEDGVVIGDDCDIASHVTITHALIGKSVRIHPGARIGRPGFGFAIDAAGFVNVPQLGRVIIEDDVDIGANTTIDRGAGPDTVIGRGTRIDNLVQIGHNVKIGRQCIIVSQVGISGSTELGDFVMAGGQAGFAGHLKVGKGAKIAAQSGVIQDIGAGSEVMGTPTVPLRQFMKQSVLLQRMATAKDKKGDV